MRSDLRLDLVSEVPNTQNAPFDLLTPELIQEQLQKRAISNFRYWLGAVR